MLRPFAAAALALLAACAAPPEASAPQGPLIVRNDPGGRYVERLDAIAEIEATKRRVEIRGRCESACTLFLGLPADQICVAPDARLGFHGPRAYVGGRMKNVPEPQRSRVVELVAAGYPPPIRAWFLANAAHLSGRTATMTGAEAVAMGIPAC